MKTLGLLLLLVFGIWLAVADAIYVANFGYAPPSSLGKFAHDVLTTPAGWNLIIVGNGIGLLFAALVLTIGVVSFPLLVDRDVGAAVALLTSIQAVVKNPVTMAVWGLIVAVLLVLGLAACEGSNVAMAPPGQDIAGKQFGPPPPPLQPEPRHR